MMTQTEISALRAHMTLAGLSTQGIAEKFAVGLSAVNQVVTGDAISARIQDHISAAVGYWPSGWRKKGDRRPA